MIFRRKTEVDEAYVQKMNKRENGNKRKKIKLKKGRAAVSGIFFMLTVVFIIAGVYFRGQSAGFSQNLVIRSEESFSSQWLESVFKSEERNINAKEGAEDAFSFAAWTELKNEFVSPEFGGRNCSADVIALYGSSHCVLPIGKNLDTEDVRGCIIGENLAKSLFGSRRVEGQKLIWMNRTWIVRGVVKEPSDFLMVQASEMTDQIVFDRISIVTGSKEDRRLKGEEFINRYGLSGQVLRWDYLYGIGWLKELIPGKWSDFEGWKQNRKIHNQEVEMLKTVEKSSIEAMGLSFRRLGAWMEIFGVMFCGAGGYFRLHKK